MLLLLDKPNTVNDLKNYFGVKAPEIIPRLKELENRNLAFKKDKEYHLTTYGEVAAKKVKPLVNAFTVVDTNEKFFNEHDLTSIPIQLLERIEEMGEGNTIESNPDDVSATRRILYDNILKSKSIKGISPVFDVSYPQFFTSLALKKIPVSIIITDHIFERVKKDNAKELRTYLSLDNAKLFTIKEARIACVVTDTFTSFSLHKRNGEFDLLTNLMSFKLSAIKWGEELFEYYQEKSTRIDQ